MNPAAIAALAALLLSQLAPLTKTKVDDRIARAMGLLVQALAENSGKPPAWQIVFGALTVLKPVFEATDWTGDEKLRAEVEDALKKLEAVIGKEYFRNQVVDIEKQWPYLAAPGVPAPDPS